MNIKKNILAAAVSCVMGFGAIGAQAATLNSGDQLTITQGAYTTANSVVTSVTGSWFGMDTDGNSRIANFEKVVLGQGTSGVIIGATTTAGASHGGCPVLGDTNVITAPWCFFANTGSDYVTTPITGSTTAGLDLSGWTVTWNGIPAIPMGTGAWEAGYSNGIANFSWSGVYGTAYSLDYRATVPIGDGSGFGGVQYALHLEGVVAGEGGGFVPIPAAAWLMTSGLLGLLGVARRKNLSS